MSDIVNLGERSDGKDKRLAVMYVHGVESAGDEYARHAITLLEEEFSRIAGVDARDALVVKPAFWAPVFEPAQAELTRRVAGDGGSGCCGCSTSWPGRRARARRPRCSPPP